MRPEQLDAMFDVVGLNKESFLDAFHQLKSDLYSQKWWVRDNLDQYTSAIIAYLVYCYVPGLPDDMRIVRFASADGDPHWFIAYPKEKVEYFNPLVHIEAAYEGVRYVIVDLAGEQTEKNYQYEPGYIMTEIMRYWPGRNAQLLAKMLGYDYKDPVRCSRGWMPSPDLEGSLEWTVDVHEIFSDREPTDISRTADEMN